MTEHSIHHPRVDAAASAPTILAKYRSRVHIVLRFARIITVLVWRSPAILLPLLRAHVRHKRGLDRSRALNDAGVAVAKTFENLGTICIKVAQILATRADVFPEAFLSPLRRLQEHVQSVPFREIKKTIEMENVVLQGTVLSIDPEPLAAGSVAQVHLATLPKPYPSRVAVKVIRRSARTSVDVDVRLLSWLARVVSRMRWLDKVPVELACDQILTLVKGQLDLVAECHSIRMYRKILSTFPRLVVPEAIVELSSRNVLVTEYVPGCRRIDSATVDDATRRSTINEVLRSLYRMIFVAGFFHCDLHPGNFFSLDGRRICVLDAGLTAVLEPPERKEFMRFFSSMAYGDGEGCTKILLRTATYIDPKLDRAKFALEIESLVERSTGTAAGSFSVVRFATSLFTIMQMNGIVGSTGFTMAILALTTFEGSIKEFYPDLNFQAMAVPFTNSAVFHGLAR